MQVLPSTYEISKTFRATPRLLHRSSLTVINITSSKKNGRIGTHASADLIFWLIYKAVAEYKGNITSGFPTVAVVVAFETWQTSLIVIFLFGGCCLKKRRVSLNSSPNTPSTMDGASSSRSSILAWTPVPRVCRWVRANLWLWLYIYRCALPGFRKALFYFISPAVRFNS